MGTSPQWNSPGSILGPILFSLFVNDLPQEVRSLISLFADDTKIHIPLTSDEAAIQLQEDLWTLESWAERMQMHFHPKKCKII
jgi:ribonuclease P/MRP protein subunit RPP40